MDNDFIRNTVMKEYYRFCCPSQERYTPATWAEITQETIPRMAEKVACEYFYLGVNPITNPECKVIKEVLKRLKFNGSWTEGFYE